jgi:hypothetical protein
MALQGPIPIEFGMVFPAGAHVDFARQLAAKAWAYAVAVERRYRGLPPLPDVPVPYTLTAEAEALLATEPERMDLVPLPGGREVMA